MDTTVPDRRDAIVPNSPPRVGRPTQSASGRRDPTASTETFPSTNGFPVPRAPPGIVPDERSVPSSWSDDLAKVYKPLASTDDRFSQSDRPLVDGSQGSNTTNSSDRVFTPTPSDGDTSGGPARPIEPSQHSPLRHLSALAATQDRIMAEQVDVSPVSGPRKRMADGEVKSPIRGNHSRNTSTVSVVSTASTIGELSTDLKTRLSYAMLKVNNGWQGHTLDEVESLASQAASPVSTPSTTAHRRHGSSSASPQQSTISAAHVHFAPDLVSQRHTSRSPPSLSENKPTLAPPAPIRPAAGHPRRNSNPRYTPTMLSHSRSSASRNAAQPPPINTNQIRRRGMPDDVLYSPHQNVREQDAIESLISMSSPNNSLNLKHSFSPAGSPGPASQPTPRSSGGRHALPTGPRKALPSQRPQASKRPGFDASPGMGPPDSPMDLDSPQAHDTPNRAMPRRKLNGSSGYPRATLPLPAGLGSQPTRKAMTDRDVDELIERETREANSSDDELIELPPRGSGVTAGILRI